MRGIINALSRSLCSSDDSNQGEHSGTRSSRGFDTELCVIPTVYCGSKSSLPSYKRGDRTKYTRKGTPKECLSKGIGAGVYQELRNNISENSLLHIYYIGKVHNKNFEKHGIKTKSQLISYVRPKSKTAIEKFLIKVLTKSNGTLDLRAYNSVLLFLHDSKVKGLPKCVKL